MNNVGGQFDHIIGLQEEAREILAKLESRNVPPTGLNYFTVGDSFRSNLFTLKENILSLSGQPKSLERTIIGGFGAGKTHFLRYLDWLLQKDALNECVISKVDMSDLRDINEFEFLVVQGLRPAKPVGQNYADVLRQAFLRVREVYLSQYHNVSQRDIELFYGTIIFSILGQTSQGWINKEILQLMGISDPLDKLINYFSGKTIQGLFDLARTNASADHVSFVDNYLQMIRSPNTPISAFEEPARKLANRGHLTDVIFKVLYVSGIKLAVLLVDELESLSRFETYDMRKILVSIRDFRDSFSNIGTTPGYPSIAFITTSTGVYFEKIREEEPALYSRWDGNFIPLEFMSAADMDNLIFKLRELYYLAGYKLAPVTIQDGIHDVIQLRQEILNIDLKDTNDRTTRKLITILLEKVKKKWVL